MVPLPSGYSDLGALSPPLLPSSEQKHPPRFRVKEAVQISEEGLRNQGGYCPFFEK